MNWVRCIPPHRPPARPGAVSVAGEPSMWGSPGSSPSRDRDGTQNPPSGTLDNGVGYPGFGSGEALEGRDGNRRPVWGLEGPKNAPAGLPIGSCAGITPIGANAGPVAPWAG